MRIPSLRTVSMALAASAGALAYTVHSNLSEVAITDRFERSLREMHIKHQAQQAQKPADIPDATPPAIEVSLP